MINREKFFEVYRQHWPLRGPSGSKRVGSIEFLLNKLEADKEMTDARFRSYTLATTKHETDDTFRPITERGDRGYFEKYEPWTSIGQNLGNMIKGDGYLFRGRGFCQITGRNNYQKFAALLGIPLVDKPDLALDPEVAYAIMSAGMIRGLFTGRALRDYFSQTKTDFLHARQIINRMDMASKIAGHALVFQDALAA